jgi:pyruvate formate lyase activating enzyme
MRDVPPTPASTLRRAREIAVSNGLRFVYTGNVHDAEGGTTYCSACGTAVIIRDWYDIRRYHVDEKGSCRSCGAALPGMFDGPMERWGHRRLPIFVASH